MLGFLQGMPVLVKVLGALALILLLSRFTGQLLLSIGAAAVLLAFWTGHSPSAAARIAWERLVSVNNLMLLAIVLQVIWLSSQMAETGVMEELVEAVRARVSQRGSMAVLPAVIGLLPMPGGALFSAPLVDSVDVNGEVAPGLKAQTNHWFRHVWEYWWLLYPGVLLAIEITGLEIWQFVAIQFPLTLGAVGAGYLFLLRKIEPTASVRAADGQRPPSLLRLVLPIIVVIVVYMLVRGGYSGVQRAWAGAPELNKYLPMFIGLFTAMLVLQRQRPLQWAGWRGILFSRRAFLMAAIVAVVRVYGAFIEARLPGGALLVEQMRTEMHQWGIPLLGIVMVVPFVSGLATGLSVGFVGASFPIVVNLLGADPQMGRYLATVVLAFGFGYMGMLISPVHVCLVVTSKHFGTQLLRNVTALAKPAALVLVYALLWHFAVLAIFG